MQENIAELAYEALSARKPDWSLDQPFYVSQELFDLEMNLFFTRQWLFAAMTCEVPETGDWIRVDVGRESVILLRDKAGVIRGFHNTCRHRGSRICTGDKGYAARLVCPYHQWSYELDGSLVRTRLMGAEFDPGDFGLIPVSVGVAGGFIYINFLPDAPDFDSFRVAVEPYLLPHGLDDAKVVYTQALTEKANWKLVIENNRECYHCVGSHPELMHIITEFDDPEDPNIRPEYKALITRKAEEWDKLGLPHAHTQGSDRYRAVRLPFTGGMQSMTMDGKPASKKLLGTLSDPDLGSVRLLNLPNSWNHVLADHAIVFRVLPINAEETLVTTKWLVHKDAREHDDYDISKLIEVWAATNDQDRVLAETNQLGIRGSGYRSGPYSAVIEGGTRDFIRWYSHEMMTALKPPGQVPAPLAGKVA